MTRFDDMLSLYGDWGFEQQFTDLLAVLRDAPRETNINGAVGDIRAQDVIPVRTFSFTPEQSATYPTRLVGEGADSNTLQVGVVKTRASATLPVMAPTVGWVDPVVATLWDCARLAHWGTATAIRSKLYDNNQTGTLPSTDVYIYVTNVADFMAMPLPFNAILTPLPDTGEVAETVQIISVNKRLRRLETAAPRSFAHGVANVELTVRPYYIGPEREPAFSLMSMREGMLTPCLVSKLTLDANAGKPLDMVTEFAFLETRRDKQVDLRAARTTLLAAASKKGPGRIINGTEVAISSSAAASGTFGLSVALGDSFFGGYQGHEIHPLTVTGVSLAIDNHITEVHSAHSLQTGTARLRENRLPFALASEGRTISGKIKYKSPLEWWAVAERLAGPSSLSNGGIVINFGAFKVTLSEIAWRPAKSEGDAAGDDQERTLEWEMVAENLDAMPYLEYAESV